ncbi:tetrapyrrole-binding protein, chloroplastic [Phoenix dactylifera]|uniref:Tetrapyrrole-binding protein, chloroplastic n=1 Tax=Phoenix dactylifera TaxID=42345 RepID=A0A8B7CJ54_PHODC|nr:tetrapyrrole-binding protein, chloroplastic [Phoenix dactylifera]
MPPSPTSINYIILHSIPQIPYPSYLPSRPLSMATTSLQSLFHPHHHSFTSTPDSSLFLKPATTPTKLLSNLSSSSITTTPSSPITPTTTTSSSSSFAVIARHLEASDFRQADEETRRLLIALAGDAAQKRGYVFFSEVQFIDAADLQAIDRLWRLHSSDRFGYSVQRRIWEKSRRDFSRFFIRVGWMKRLDTEVEQYTYRAFPDEFIWELKDDTPEGHLPLTNALRGTQLLARILTHPAFEEESLEEEEEEEKEGEGGEKDVEKERPKPLSNTKTFKPDYSF